MGEGMEEEGKWEGGGGGGGLCEETRGGGGGFCLFKKGMSFNKSDVQRHHAKPEL